MADRNTKIRANQLKDFDVRPNDINAINSPSNDDSLTYDLTTELFSWEQREPVIEVVTTYSGLPSSPTTRQKVFYTPFECIVTWDGANWIGEKIFHTLFGRRGRGSFPIWLNSVGTANAFPKATGTNGLYMPEFTEGNSWRVYELIAKSDTAVTGDLEIHDASSSIFPVYGTSGICKVSFSNSKHADINFTTPFPSIGSHNRLQCYMRRTAGTWDNLLVTLVLAKCACGASK